MQVPFKSKSKSNKEYYGPKAKIVVFLQYYIPQIDIKAINFIFNSFFDYRITYGFSRFFYISEYHD